MKYLLDCLGEIHLGSEKVTTLWDMNLWLELGVLADCVEERL